MAEYLIQSETLDDIADAINAKTGGSSAMTPAQMVTAIGSISGGVPLNGVVMNSGSFTVASSVGNTISINHGLAKIPFMVIVMPTENAFISENRNLGGLGIVAVVGNSLNYNGLRFYANGADPTYTHNPHTEINNTPSTTYVCGFTSTKFDYVASSGFPSIAAEYQWLAFAFKET